MSDPAIVVADLTGGSSPARSPWPAVLSVALGAAVFCTTEFLPIGLLRYVSESLHVSEGTAGLMVSIPGLLAAIAAPMLTVVAGSLDRRRVLVGLAALLLASNLIAMVAPSFAVLVAGRVLFGIGLGGFWAIGAGLGGRLVPAASVGRATSTIFAGVSIGMLVGGAAGALIGDMVGWRAAFAVAAGLSAIALVVQALYLPPLRVEHRVRPRDLLGIVATPAGRTGLAAMTVALCGQFVAYTYVTPFLSSQTGFDGPTISSVLFGFTVVGLVGNFIGGAAATRHLKLTLSVAIASLAAPLLLLPLLGTGVVPTLSLLAVWGLAYGAIPIALQMWMAQAAPRAQEGAMALFVANFQLSIALGSFGGGLVFDRLGVMAAMSFGGALALAGLAVLWTFSTGSRQTHDQPPEEH